MLWTGSCHLSHVFIKGCKVHRRAASAYLRPECPRFKERVVGQCSAGNGSLFVVADKHTLGLIVFWRRYKTANLHLRDLMRVHVNLHLYGIETSQTFCTKCEDYVRVKPEPVIHYPVFIPSQGSLLCYQSGWMAGSWTDRQEKMLRSLVQDTRIYEGFEVLLCFHCRESYGMSSFLRRALNDSLGFYGLLNKIKQCVKYHKP